MSAAEDQRPEMQTLKSSSANQERCVPASQQCPSWPWGCKVARVRGEDGHLGKVLPCVIATEEKST